jgi:hypothetical protein
MRVRYYVKSAFLYAHLIMYYVMALSVRGHFSFPDFFFFFAIFAATALKLDLLLCSKDLQFHFAFQCD